MASATNLQIEYFSEHQCDDLIRLFNQCFEHNWKTQLIKGGTEPIYLPANNRLSCHQIVFTQNYFSSALHEIAHWCIAGAERRLLEDYGYWYAPDGRSVRQQSQFERVESRPQALEWFFAKACKSCFNVSEDNLNGLPEHTDAFKRAVVSDACAYAQKGLPARAQIFYQSLASYYCGPADSSLLRFDIGEL